MAKTEVATVKRAKHGTVLSIFMALLSLAWIAPILIVVMNSFKRKAYIFKYPFGISTAKLADGIDKFRAGMEKMACGLLNYSNAIKKTLFLFSMIVPFQMVMFTLSKFANILHLSTPLGIVIVYLGFGAGLSVFMFTGFIKGVSLEIEEAAMIDGCNPIQTFFLIVFPILKPTTITVAILQAMWIWNDYLLPALVLNINKFKTIPIAIQYLKQSHGQVDWGAMMAVLVLAIVPIVVFYLACQKYIIEGVMAGAVKG